MIVHELEVAKRLIFYAETKEKSCFDLQNRATILLQVWDILSRKKCAPIYENRATIWQTLQLGFEFNEAIVLRFTASEYNFRVDGNFPIKGKLFTEGRGRNFRERNWLLELEIWREGGRPSKLISDYQFHVMNPSFTLVICALVMSS